MEKVRFIFDLDGTILDSDYSYEKKYFERVLSSEDSKRFIPMISKLLEKYEKTYEKYDFNELKNFLIKETGILFSDEIILGWYDALINSNSKEIDGIRDVFEYLKFKNKSIVVLTNWITEVQLERLKRVDLSKYIDEIYGGDIVLKPNRDSYMLACGKYSTDNCIMIGDSLDNDVIGPNIYGLDSLYYNPNNKEHDKVRVKSIKNMSKIKEMF